MTIYFNRNRKVDRRTVLRGAGVSMALPWLTAMESAHAVTSTTQNRTPKRFVAMTLGLGLIGSNLNPEQSGRDYEPSLYLRNLQDIRDRFTVISGTSHPGVSGGHRAEASILTANPVGSSGKARNTISIDQYMARHLGNETPIPKNRGCYPIHYPEKGAICWVTAVIYEHLNTLKAIDFQRL